MYRKQLRKLPIRVIKLIRGSVIWVADIKAIEVMGQIDKNGELHLDEALPVHGPSRVRVIVLIQNPDAIEEHDWLQAASSSPAFEFLKDQEEDIYTLFDGKPFND